MHVHLIRFQHAIYHVDLLSFGVYLTMYTVYVYVYIHAHYLLEVH